MNLASKKIHEHCWNCIYKRPTLKKDREISLAHVILYLSGRSKNVTMLELILRDGPRSPRGVFRSMLPTQAAVKRKQKSLSREQQDRFDEAHAPKFNSTSGPVTCSHRSDKKPRLNE